MDTVLDSTIRGGILHAPDGNDETIEETLEYAIPDWAKCVSDAGLGPGYLSYAGYDRDAVDPDINDGNMSTISKKYQDLESFCLHTQDDEGNDVDWYGSVATDDTLEISFEGSGGNVEYAVYVITDISVVDTFTVSLRLRYVGASHPEEDFNLTGTNTYYQLRTYTRNVTTAGATFDGPVRVKADDDEALSARRKTGSTERTFFVNTNDHRYRRV